MADMTTVDLAANDWTTIIASSDGTTRTVFAAGTVFLCASAAKPSNVPPDAPCMPIRRGEATPVIPASGDKLWAYWKRDGENAAASTLKLTLW